MTTTKTTTISEKEAARMIAERLVTHPATRRPAPRALALRMGRERAADWIERNAEADPCCEEG